MSATRDVIWHPTVIVRDQLTWRRPLEVSIVVLIAISWCIATDHTLWILPLAVGAWFAGIADSAEPIGIHWRTMIWFTLWIAFAGTLGGLAYQLGYWELIIVAAVSLCAGFACCLSARAAFGATITLVIYAVFAGVPTTAQGAFLNGALIIAGGLLSTVVAIARTAVTNPKLLEYNDHPDGPVLVRLRKHLNPDDDMFRHAVRLAIAMVVATTVADYLTWPHEYWIPMTVAWVAKPDRNGTVIKVWERIVGTLIAIALVDLILIAINGMPYAHAVVAAIGAAVSLIFLRANYAITVVGVTVTVLAVFSLMGEPVVDTSLTRVKATILAGIITLGATLIWPPRRVTT